MKRIEKVLRVAENKARLARCRHVVTCRPRKSACTAGPIIVGQQQGCRPTCGISDVPSSHRGKAVIGRRRTFLIRNGFPVTVAKIFGATDRRRSRSDCVPTEKRHEGVFFVRPIVRPPARSAGSGAFVGLQPGRDHVDAHRLERGANPFREYQRVRPSPCRQTVCALSITHSPPIARTCRLRTMSSVRAIIVSSSSISAPGWLRGTSESAR